MPFLNSAISYQKESFLVKVKPGDAGAQPRLVGWAPQPRLIVPVFLQQLTSTSSNLRWQALSGLAACGTNAQVAGPKIVTFLTDSDLSVRIAATYALLTVDTAVASQAGIQ